MRNFDYITNPAKLLTPEIDVYKRQLIELYINKIITQ